MTLNCLLQDANATAKAKSAVSQAGRKLDNAGKFVGVGAVSKILKGHGIEINNDAIAFLYKEVFNSQINTNINFETDEALDSFKTKPTPLKEEIKNGFISKGFSKKNNLGRVIMDWKSLMNGKTETEIRNAIQSLGLNLSQKEENNLLEDLQHEWSLILRNVLEKATKVKNISTEQKTAIGRLAQILSLNATDQFENIYNEAIAKIIGISPSKIDSINRIKEMKKKLDIMSANPYAMGSNLEKDLQDALDKVIYDAQSSFDKNGGIGKNAYAAVNIVSKMYDATAMAILNNVNGIVQNVISGLTATLIKNKAKQNHETTEIARAYFTNVAVHNKTGFGSATTTFTGQTDVIKDITNFLLPKSMEDKTSGKVAKGFVNALMGVTALNGADSLFKAKMSWITFLENAETILMKRRKIGVEEARKILNEQMFGESWDKAKEKAKNNIDDMNSKGAEIPVTDATIKIFASDIIRFQLVENKILTIDDLNNAWDASIKSAGHSLGHVANNGFSNMLNLGRSHIMSSLQTALRNGDYGNAIKWAMMDIVGFKIIGRFVGGGLNWVVLASEYAGGGVIRGGVGLMINKNKKLEHIADPKTTNTDIKNALYNNQKNWDRINRGLIGGVTLLAFALMFTDDEDEKREIIEWLNNHETTKEMFLKVVPSLIALYFVHLDEMNEKDEPLDLGEDAMSRTMKDVSNLHKYSKERAFALSLFNQRIDGDVEKFIKSLNDTEKAKEIRGKMLGQFLPLNPFPTRSAVKFLDWNNEIHDYLKDKTEGKTKGFLEGAGYFKKTKEEIEDK